jgi:hypothetical protein
MLASMPLEVSSGLLGGRRSSKQAAPHRMQAGAGVADNSIQAAHESYRQTVIST